MFMQKHQLYMEVVYNLWTMLMTHPFVVALCLILMTGALGYGGRYLWKNNEQMIESLKEPKPVSTPPKNEGATSKPAPSGSHVTLIERQARAAAPSPARSKGSSSSLTRHDLIPMHPSVTDNEATCGSGSPPTSSHSHSHHASGSSWSQDHSHASSSQSSYSGGSGYSDGGHGDSRGDW